MLSLSIFGASLIGLLALFGCKVFELSKQTRTPLTHLRRIGDPFLKDGLTYAKSRFRKFSFALIRVCALWLRSVIHKTELFFDHAIHAIAARLNRYLRAKRSHLRNLNDVSPHLKTVLEKVEERAKE